MKRRITLFFALAAGSFAARHAVPGLDAERFVDHVKFLASPELRGRASGSPELEKAAHYIARQFRRDGLKPIDGKSYFQAFEVTTNARLGTQNQFQYSLHGKPVKLKFQDDFIPFNFSSKARLEGSVVFAGYGITAREYHYDDYAGIDAKGKIVLLLRHEPQESDEGSVFAGKIFTEHSQFAAKVTNAKNHGALGVILINDRANHRGESDNLETFGKTAGPGDAGVPFVQIRTEVAEQWISAGGRNLDELMSAIDKDLQPRSFPLPAFLRVDMNVDVERAVRTVHNVAGYLPGETPEHIVIGAHYDHLGLGEQFSMAPSMAGATHPGADDNASGTAGVLELARYFAAQPRRKRGILFLAFAGEELGLLGSSYYVKHAVFPIDQAVAMINMDMIGRLRDGKVYIGGVGSGSGLKNLIEPIVARYPLKVDYSESVGYGSSDHVSFISKQVPSLFFFSGLHADYHKPSDTWDKIDGPGSVTLLHLIADIGSALRDETSRPQFVRVAPPQSAHAGSASGSGGGSGYGAYFGSVPDFGETKNGVKFADVTPESPAAKAGLKAGDILTEFDGKPVQNLYDFTYALRTHKPGEEVSVKVLRGPETVEAKVTLTRRK